MLPLCLNAVSSLKQSIHTLWSRSRSGFLTLCGGGARRLDHQMYRQAVLDVVRAKGLVVLHDFTGEDQAQLIGLRVELFRDRLLELPAYRGNGRRRGGRKKKEKQK